MGIPYRLNENDIPENLVIELNDFIQAYYYKNENLFLIKLAIIRCAIEEIPTGKMLFEIGPGGCGKSLMNQFE